MKPDDPFVGPSSPAFPADGCPGLTKREYLAAMVLAALLSDGTTTTDASLRNQASAAVRAADALALALGRPPTTTTTTTTTSPQEGDRTDELPDLRSHP